MIQLLPIAVGAWLLTAALLVVEHAYFKDQGRIIRYILGGTALCLGTTLAGVLANDPLLVVFPWVILSSGVVIIGLTWWERERETANQNGQRRGEVVGMARGLRQELTQAMIDRGEASHGDDPTRN